MNLYRMELIATGESVIVVGKSPVAARKAVAATLDDQRWASTTGAEIKSLKPTGKTDRILYGPMPEDAEITGQQGEDAGPSPVTTEQAIDHIAGLAGEWLIQNQDKVRAFVSKFV